MFAEQQIRGIFSRNAKTCNFAFILPPPPGFMQATNDSVCDRKTHERQNNLANRLPTRAFKNNLGVTYDALQKVAISKWDTTLFC